MGKRPDNSAPSGDISQFAVPVTRLTNAVGWITAALLLMGLSALGAYGRGLRTHFDRHPPREYYPVQSFRTVMVVAGGEVYLAPSGDPGDLTPEPNIPDEHRAGAHRVLAQVTVERPIPLRSVQSGRNVYYKGYDRWHSAPGSAIQRAGPEFGVTVNLWAYGVPIARSQRDKVLHRLADDIMSQSGDATLAQSVREDGKDAPPIPITELPPWTAPLWYFGWSSLVTAGGCVLGLYVRGRRIRRRMLEDATATSGMLLPSQSASGTSV